MWRELVNEGGGSQGELLGIVFPGQETEIQ